MALLSSANDLNMSFLCIPAPWFDFGVVGVRTQNESLRQVFNDQTSKHTVNDTIEILPVRTLLLCPFIF